MVRSAGLLSIASKCLQMIFNAKKWPPKKVISLYFSILLCYFWRIVSIKDPDISRGVSPLFSRRTTVASSRFLHCCSSLKVKDMLQVIDEYDEQYEVAERLRIRTVPLFHFYKDGVLLESFATRDKERIDEAIHMYTSPVPQES